MFYFCISEQYGLHSKRLVMQYNPWNIRELSLVCVVLFQVYKQLWWIYVFRLLLIGTGAAVRFLKDFNAKVLIPDNIGRWLANEAWFWMTCVSKRSLKICIIVIYNKGRTRINNQTHFASTQIPLSNCNKNLIRFLITTQSALRWRLPASFTGNFYWLHPVGYMVRWIFVWNWPCIKFNQCTLLIFLYFWHNDR